MRILIVLQFCMLMLSGTVDDINRKSDALNKSSQKLRSLRQEPSRLHGKIKILFAKIEKENSDLKKKGANLFDQLQTMEIQIREIDKKIETFLFRNSAQYGNVKDNRKKKKLYDSLLKKFLGNKMLSKLLVTRSSLVKKQKELQVAIASNKSEIEQNEKKIHNFLFRYSSEYKNQYCEFVRIKSDIKRLSIKYHEDLRQQRKLEKANRLNNTPKWGK